jgi:hypothetical protein
VKTTLQLPVSLWKAAKTRAMNERSDMRSVIVEALQKHLGLKVEKKGAKNVR